jgi:hypothetical protein
MTDPIGNLKAHPMIRPDAIPNNHASPSSHLIPLIRLEKPTAAPLTTPDQGHEDPAPQTREGGWRIRLRLSTIAACACFKPA